VTVSKLLTLVVRIEAILNTRLIIADIMGLYNKSFLPIHAIIQEKIAPESLEQI
jgi:hypothetical protein